MQYTFEQFIEDVKAEAKALREHATKEELDRLDIEALDPGRIDKCMYGLITGDCTSERALSLIDKCCQKFFNNSFSNGFGSLSEQSVLEMARSNVDIKSMRGASIYYISSIEAYISILNARNAVLIAYLRGETDELILV